MITHAIRGMVAALLVLHSPTLLQGQALKVTLLGTGGPEPTVDRFGPGTLVEVGSEKLLFDAE